MNAKIRSMRSIRLISAVAALAVAVPATPQNDMFPELEAAVAPVSAEVPIALLVDASNGQVLFTREADRRFVPASVTKVMTAYTAFRLVDEGNLSLDMAVDITPELLGDWRRKGSTLFLEPGDRITVEDLLLGITTVSANDASIVLARVAAGSVPEWTDLMNDNARALGMADSHFGTPNGWMDDGNTFTTANDLARLGEALTQRYPNLYGRFFGKRGMRYNGFAQDNHEMLTGRVEGGDGIKTGYTRQAGHTFLGSAERDGRRLILVVAGADEQQTRNETARNLIRWGYTSLGRRTFAKAGDRVGMVEVQNGAVAQVPLALRDDLTFASAAGMDDVRMSIRYDGPIKAPIAKGTKVAVLRIAARGMPVYEQDLIAQDDVREAGTIRRIGQGFAAWFS